MKLLLVAILIGNFKVTSYRSVPEQTDESPNYTSIGEKVHSRGVAVSRDLLKKNGGPLNYGDLVYIESVGFKFINDTMNARHKRRFDVWVQDLEDEQEFHRKFKKTELRVWVIKQREDKDGR